jgi:hypothetical protein
MIHGYRRHLLRLQKPGGIKAPAICTCIMGCMSIKRKISLLQQRRDDIREWLELEAPFAEVDQKHLDANTPERAYWHHGYQAALADIITLLAAQNRRSGSADILN